MIDQFSIIIIFSISILVPDSLKKVIADSINHIVIVTLANNCLKEFLFSQARSWIFEFALVCGVFGVNNSNNWEITEMQ